MNQAAAGKVGAGHDSFAVSNRVLHAAAPKAGVKHVVCIARNKANGNLACAVVKARTHIGVSGKYVHKPAVPGRALRFDNLFAVYPRMPVLDAALRLRGYHDFGVRPLLLHLRHLSN